MSNKNKELREQPQNKPGDKSSYYNRKKDATPLKERRQEQINNINAFDRMTKGAKHEDNSKDKK